jgi:hypothetical protein
VNRLVNIASIVLAGAILASALGLVSIHLTNIKAYDRKVTIQSYNYHGGTYEWDQVKANVLWEDGAFILNDHYDQRLDRDLNYLVDSYDTAVSIDEEESVIKTPDYLLKVCFEDFDYSLNDTTLTKTLGASRTSGYLELYDKSGDTLLYKHQDRRFIITNRMTITGMASEPYIANKMKELVYTEVLEMAPDFIYRYEGSHRRKIKMATKFVLESIINLPHYNVTSNRVRLASIEPRETNN